MKLKRLPFTIQDKNSKDLDFAKDYPTIADLMREQCVAKDYPTIADLMREQSVSNDDKNTVHRRRDLDSLG